MRKKFDRYTINISNKKKTANQLSCTISGTIEIGIEIDEWTWRGDWLIDQFFPQNIQEKNIIRLSNIVNNITMQNGVEYNNVQASYIMTERRMW